MDSQALVVLVSAAVAAFGLGTVVAEWRLRAQALAQVAQVLTDLKTTTAEISRVHNELAAKILGLQDQINSHEFKLTSTKR